MDVYIYCSFILSVFILKVGRISVGYMLAFIDVLHFCIITVCDIYYIYTCDITYHIFCLHHMQN